MEPLFLLLLMGAAAGGLAYSLHRHSRRASMWTTLAQAAGFHDIRQSDTLGFKGRVDARCGALAVRIESFQRGKHKRGTRMILKGAPDEVSLKSEGLGSRIEKTLGAREIETGDAAFDAELFLQGPPLGVRAVLDAETRRLAREAFAGRVRLDDRSARTIRIDLTWSRGTLTAEFPDRFGNDAEPLLDTMKTLVDLAQRLQARGEPERCLSEIARRDPLGDVRGQALATLVRECPQHPAAREALRAACEDADEDVRLQAGLALGSEGRAVLSALAANGSTKDACAAQAIEALRSHLPFEAASRILRDALAAGRTLSACAALRTLGHGGPAEARVIAEVVESGEGGVAIEAARALAKTRAPQAEEVLLRAVERGPDDLRFAAVEGLGLVATAHAVLPLKELQDRVRGALHKVAREAVVRIQSRLTGATPGQVALADGGEGQVSLAEDERGRIALDPTQPQ